MPNKDQLTLFANAPRNRGGDDRVQVQLWHLGEENDTFKARCFLTERDGGKRVYVPRSLMSLDQKRTIPEGSPLVLWEFTLPRWKAKQLGLEPTTDMGATTIFRYE